jgi:hypothetical protein
VSKEIDATRNYNLSRQARQALAALQKLQLLYSESKAQEEMDQLAEEQVSAGIAAQEPTVQPGQKPSSPGEQQAPAQGEPKAVGATRNVPKTPAPNTKPEPTKESSEDLTKQIEEVEGILAQYVSDFQFLIEEALNEDISRDNFEARLAEVVMAILIAIWLRGANMSSVAELTAAERFAIQGMLDPHLNAISGLSEDLYTGRYDESPSSALTRIFVWSNMAAGVYFLGLAHRRDDPNLQWIYTPDKDHCGDCLRLNGQVHTATEWRASGFMPRSIGLECKGFHCGCRFSETTKSIKGSF